MWCTRLTVIFRLVFALVFIASFEKAAYGQGLGGSVLPQYPSPLVVGQTGVQATLTITNGSQGIGPVTVMHIQLNTACSTGLITYTAATHSFTCTDASFPGVITLSPSGTGMDPLNVGNTTCTGGWTIALNAAIGMATFTHTGGDLVLATPSDQCIISFTMGAAALPPPLATTPPNTVYGVAGVVFSSPGLMDFPQTGGTFTLIESCGASIDKQVSCDGGTTWQDMTGTDDATGISTNGCVANTGAPLLTRFVITNTGATPISSCNLSDTPAANNPLVFFSPVPVPISFPGGLAVGMSFPPISGAAGVMCTLTSGQNGTNTANLTGCICPTSTNPVTAPLDAHDTATIACAGVKIDKEISCNAGGAFVDNTGGTGGEAGTGLVTHNEDGTNGCIAQSGLPAQVEAKFLAKSLGNAALTCGLMDTNPSFIPAPFSGISLATNAITPVGPGTTGALECLAARGVPPNVKEPDTATLSCTVNPMTGIVDKTAASSLTVFDSATFTCIPLPSFTSSKTCTPTSPGASTFNTNVTVNNTSSGSTTLSCTIADSYVSGACPGSGASTNVTMAPNPLLVGAFPASNVSTGTLTTSTEVCNRATVTCTPSAGVAPPSQTVTADCVPPTTGIKLKKTFSADAIVSGAGSINFTVINQGSIPQTGIGFSDVLPPGLTETNVIGTCNGGTFTFNIGTDTVTLAGGSLPPFGSCIVTVNFTAAVTVPPVRVCDTTSIVTSDQATGGAATACLTVGSTVPIAPLDSFQTLYAANLNIADSTINITNSGALGGTDPAGDLCVNLYAFDPREELIACCTCVVTPDGLNSFSVQKDLINNPLTPNIPTSLMIKVVTNLTDPGLCNVTPGFQNLQSGTVAWGSTIEPSSGWLGSGDSTPGHYGVVRVPAKLATLSPSELSGLTQVCNFIRQNGSGYGICNSCRTGGLGGAKKK